jgi:uncharacterized protein YodC (DUF2158 family)
MLLVDVWFFSYRLRVKEAVQRWVSLGADRRCGSHVLKARCFLKGGNKLKVGDVVVLKSGGFKMTIDKIYNYREGKKAHCVWFVGNQRQQDLFGIECLNLATVSSQPVRVVSLLQANKGTRDTESSQQGSDINPLNPKE